MPELGNVNPIQKLSCPDCGALLDDHTLARLMDEDTLECPSCGRRIRLPEQVVQKVRASRFTGRNLDITA